MSMPPAPTVYLASPDGFTQAGLTWHRQVLVPAVSAAGLVPLSPWLEVESGFAPVAAMEPGAARIAAYRRLNAAVGAANAALIDRSQGMLAVLDGVDVDSGTASEIGYGSARGLVIVGVRTDARLTGDNEGAVVNLQVEHFVRAGGGDIFTSVESAVARLASALRARS